MSVCSNYRTISLVSHASKNSPASYYGQNQKSGDVQAGFKAGRGTRGQIVNLRLYGK